MQSKAATVDQYLAELPADRREALETLRALFKKNLDKGMQERMGYGMMGYAIPHSIYPNGYHCDPSSPLPFAGCASQKNAMSLYLMHLYMDPAEDKWFRAAWAKTGKKLDMGKSCIRFKKIDDLALDVIAEALRRVTIKDYIAAYEGNLSKSKYAKKPAAKPAKRETTKHAAKSAKKPASKVAKKPAKKK